MNGLHYNLHKQYRQMKRDTILYYREVGHVGIQVIIEILIACGTLRHEISGEVRHQYLHLYAHTHNTRDPLCYLFRVG